MQITLEDKYTKNQGKVFVTGSQVLVKLPLVQKKLDEKSKFKYLRFHLWI